MPQGRKRKRKDSSKTAVKAVTIVAKAGSRRVPTRLKDNELDVFGSYKVFPGWLSSELTGKLGRRILPLNQPSLVVQDEPSKQQFAGRLPHKLTRDQPPKLLIARQVRREKQVDEMSAAKDARGNRERADREQEPFNNRRARESGGK